MVEPIAVFDSGVGGLSVLRALVRQMPQEHFLYFGDSANAPYGSRPTGEIRELSMNAAKRLFGRGAKALVVACNTATSAAIEVLRQTYPEKIIVGIEPALKLAVERHPGGRILVMATEATLREQKFEALLERFQNTAQVVKCPCPELVRFVERNQLDGAAVEAYLRQVLPLEPPADAVVLGCTHFPFAAQTIGQVVGQQVELLDGADGTAKETRRRLAEAGLLLTQGTGSIELTDSLPSMLPLCRRLLDI